MLPPVNAGPPVLPLVNVQPTLSNKKPRTFRAGLSILPPFYGGTRGVCSQTPTGVILKPVFGLKNHLECLQAPADFQ